MPDVARGPVLLEVCVDTVAGLHAAVAGGADRVELCSALALGGLTPSAGLMAAAAHVPVPVRAMIRPRAGDFVYAGGDHDVMRRDIDAARACGLAGIVVGANMPDGRLDMDLLDHLVRHAAGLEVTLHRAVDLVPGGVEAVDSAVALGIATILTSGGARTASAGVARMAAMQARAGDRIQIMAGSGITAETALDVIAATGVPAVHASCSRITSVADSRAVAFGFAPEGLRDTDQSVVAGLRQVLDGERPVAA